MSSSIYNNTNKIIETSNNRKVLLLTNIKNINLKLNSELISKFLAYSSNLISNIVNVEFYTDCQIRIIVKYNVNFNFKDCYPKIVDIEEEMDDD